MTKDELVYVIPAGQYGKEGVLIDNQWIVFEPITDSDV